jgi:hypothetical protein
MFFSLSHWMCLYIYCKGDSDWIGLSGIEVLDADMCPIDFSQDNNNRSSTTTTTQYLYHQFNHVPNNGGNERRSGGGGGDDDHDHDDDMLQQNRVSLYCLCDSNLISSDYSSDYQDNDVRDGSSYAKLMSVGILEEECIALEELLKTNKRGDLMGNSGGGQYHGQWHTERIREGYVVDFTRPLVLSIDLGIKRAIGGVKVEMYICIYMYMCVCVKRNVL